MYWGWGFRGCFSASSASSRAQRNFIYFRTDFHRRYFMEMDEALTAPFSCESREAFACDVARLSLEVKMPITTLKLLNRIS